MIPAQISLCAVFFSLNMKRPPRITTMHPACFSKVITVTRLSGDAFAMKRALSATIMRRLSNHIHLLHIDDLILTGVLVTSMNMA